METDVVEGKGIEQQYGCDCQPEGVEWHVVAVEQCHEGINAEHGGRAHRRQRHTYHEGEDPDAQHDGHLAEHHKAAVSQQQGEHHVDDAEMQARKGKHMRCS